MATLFIHSRGRRAFSLLLQIYKVHQIIHDGEKHTYITAGHYSLFFRPASTSFSLPTNDRSHRLLAVLHDISPGFHFFHHVSALGGSAFLWGCIYSDGILS